MSMFLIHVLDLSDIWAHSLDVGAESVKLSYIGRGIEVLSHCMTFCDFHLISYLVFGSGLI